MKRTTAIAKRRKPTCFSSGNFRSTFLRANQAQDAAAKLGVTIQSVGVHDLIDFEPAFAAIASGGANAMLTLADGARRQTLLACCARAASGHATAAPPSSVMKARRFN
jgi:hypothetical protein